MIKFIKILTVIESIFWSFIFISWWGIITWNTMLGWTILAFPIAAFFYKLPTWIKELSKE